MAESPGQIPFVECDAEGRIDEDLSCLKCDYNLRTMHADGQCPECGVSTHESARIAWLWQNDPAWRRLARSTIWIGVAIICLVSPLSLPLWESVGGPFSEANAAKLFIAALTIGAAAGLYGFWQFTTPHLGGYIGRGRVRRVARWAMTAGFVGLIAAWPLTVVCCVEAIPSWMFDLPWLVFGWLILCSYVCLGVGAWATLTYAAALAAKVPEARLFKQARRVAWGFAMCFLVWLPGTPLAADFATAAILFAYDCAAPPVKPPFLY